MKRLALAVALLIGLAVPAWADYLEGEGAYWRGDYATALQEFKPLAEQGDAKAQTYLGGMYHQGKGVPLDYAAAFKWYTKAAEQGIDGAQYNLGIMYDRGQGVPQDYAMAAKWYRKAAESGMGFARLKLGLMYFLGQGVPQDYVQAHMWLNLATSRLPPGKGREGMAEIRDTVAKSMTPAQIAEAQRLAREWKPKRSGR